MKACVLRVETRGQRDPITDVGHAAMISPGEFEQASGIWTNDRTHGVQFKVALLKATSTRRPRASRNISVPT
jgi:exodeoxyribonuclease V alpha subunit